MRYLINAEVYRESLFKNIKDIKEALHVKREKDEKNLKRNENNEISNKALYIKKGENKLIRDE